MTDLPASGTNPRDVPTCPHCGRNRSSRGLPFDPVTLELHVRKCRSNTGASAGDAATAGSRPTPDSGLYCGICGATGGRRGGFFRDASDLRKHMTQCQRKCNGSSDVAAPAASAPAAFPRVAKPARRSATTEVKFCPQCGCNLEVISAALSFVR